MVTRADVAKKAGVSASTVSYALTGKRSIKPETRERILQVVAELNYVPHFAAGALRGGKSRTLAMLFPGSAAGISPVALQYITGAVNAASARGYALILWPADNADMKQIATLAKSGLLGAVLLMEIHLKDQRVAYLVEQQVPLTMIGRTADPGAINYVDRDFEEVAKSAIDYFFELGHTNIAFLTQSSEKKEKDPRGVDHRFQSAILDQAKRHKMSAVEIPSLNDPASGRLSYQLLRKKYKEVTGVLALPDLATIGFINGAHEEGISIPGDLSIISVNTPRAQINMSWPKLTTVDLPAYEMAASAINISIDELEEIANPHKQQLWAGDLLIGDSTAPVKQLTRSS
jgi:DNA-binding LacI/PurR family transcriptional regulator